MSRKAVYNFYLQQFILNQNNGINRKCLLLINVKKNKHRFSDAFVCGRLLGGGGGHMREALISSLKKYRYLRTTPKGAAEFARLERNAGS